MFAQLRFEVVPVGTHFHGRDHRSRMLPQFRVADIFCQPLEVLCSSSSGLVLWVRLLELIQNAGRKAVINNVISRETKVPGSLNVIAKFYGAGDREKPQVQDL